MSDFVIQVCGPLTSNLSPPQPICCGLALLSPIFLRAHCHFLAALLSFLEENGGGHWRRIDNNAYACGVRAPVGRPVRCVDGSRREGQGPCMFSWRPFAACCLGVLHRHLGRCWVGLERPGELSLFLAGGKTAVADAAALPALWRVVATDSLS